MRRKTNRRRVPIRVRFALLIVYLKSAGVRGVPFLLAGLVLLAVPYGAFFAYEHVVSTEYFALQSIQVSGNSRVSEREFLHQVGLVEGMNIFDVDTERVVEAGNMLPWIDKTHIEVKLPHSITIEIDEKTPAIAVQLDGQNWYADSTGELIEPGAEILETPVFLTGLDLVEETNRAGRIVDAIAVGEIVSSLDLKMSEAHYDNVLGFSVILLNGTELRVGHDQFSERLRRAKIVLDGRKEAVAYILVDHALSANRVIVGRQPANQGR